METVNIIQCPHCKALIEPWDYIDPTDMEGDFSMDCEECGKAFAVSFSTETRFTTSE